jgi:aromatic ring-opening dioxygenase catalytic subunit (LigB family)
LARVCSVIATSHSPFLYTPSEEWEPGRTERLKRGGWSTDTPIDSVEENARKEARIKAAFGVLREHLEASKPDVLLIFGDDQLEQFNFKNFPALSLYVGDAFEGYKISRMIGLPVMPGRKERPKTPETWVKVQSHPELSHALIRELMIDGFDLAFSNELSDPDEGMGHAFMRPLYYLDPEYRLPMVPFSVNCYFGPQPTGKRCYQLGRAVRAAIERIPLDLNVAVIGSGGLWHLPNYPNSWIDESFDQQILAGIKSGDAGKTAEYFDTVQLPYDPASRDSVKLASGGTGILLGVGGGTGETRNWIVAAAVADGQPGTVVDYIPVYASPIGVSFAYWDNP